MDILKFELFQLEPIWCDGPVAGVKIIINGQPLLDIVEAYEKQLVSMGVIHKAGGYTYPFAKKLYGEITDMDGRPDDNELELLICDGCMCEGCCPIYATIEETDRSVILKDFYYGHLEEYPKFGFYQFEKESFWKEVSYLKTLCGKVIES